MQRKHSRPTHEARQNSPTLPAEEPVIIPRDQHAFEEIEQSGQHNPALAFILIASIAAVALALIFAPSQIAGIWDSLMRTGQGNFHP